MKSLIQKMGLVLAIGFTGMSFAQYQQRENDNQGYQNDPYQYFDKDYNYPEEYYNEYPDDYYTQELYTSYYKDYKTAVFKINWDRFFVEFRLSPLQVREIRLLNARFTNFENWHRYYQYNPDRWYYDRFIALERILGPRMYPVFYQRYYRHNPIVYFKNYRLRHYKPMVYVAPRYRGVAVHTFRRDDFRKGGFGNERNPNNGNKEYADFRGNNQNRGKGFRNEAEPFKGGLDLKEQKKQKGFRTETFGHHESAANENQRKGFRSGSDNPSESVNNSNRGFR